MNQLIPIGEACLHRATSNSLLHDQQERNHQGSENKIIRSEFNPFPSHGVIKCRKRLGEILRYFCREAA